MCVQQTMHSICSIVIDDDAEVEVGRDFARAANEDRIAPVAGQMAEEPFDSGSFRITSLFGGRKGNGGFGCAPFGTFFSQFRNPGNRGGKTA